MIICSSGWCECGTCIHVWMCTASVNVYDLCCWWQWRVALVASKDDNKSPSCCHKTQPPCSAFKCYVYSQRAADTLQSRRREKKEAGKKKSQKERELGREARGAWRPVAEGLILNVLQRQCLLSSLASPLTAPVSKQELYPLPPTLQKEDQEMQWLLKTRSCFPGQSLGFA